MSRNSVIFFLALGFTSPLTAQISWADTYPPSQVGPTSAEESMLLWMEGKSAFEKKKYSDAVRSLQRIVDRYPGTKAYTEAHYYLGLSYLRSKEPSKALAPLKYYVQAKLDRSELILAKLALSRAYSEARKHHEGFLASEELLEMHRQQPLKSDAFGEALLLKTRALIGLAKWDDANATLDTFFTADSKDSKSSSVRTEAYRLQAESKVHECKGFPKLDSKGRAKEADVRADLVKRGNCVLELQGILQKTMDLDVESPWTLEARTLVKSAFQDFEHACLNPPPPPGKLSALQLKRYKAELSEALKKDCGEALSRKKADL